MLSDCLPPSLPTEWPATSHSPLFTPCASYFFSVMPSSHYTMYYLFTVCIMLFDFILSLPHTECVLPCIPCSLLSSHYNVLHIYFMSSMLSDCLPPFPPTEWSPTSHSPLFTPCASYSFSVVPSSHYTMYYLSTVCIMLYDFILSLPHTECVIPCILCSLLSSNYNVLPIYFMSSKLSDCLPPFPPTEWSPTSHSPLFTPSASYSFSVMPSSHYTMYYLFTVCIMLFDFILSLPHTECVLPCIPCSLLSSHYNVLHIYFMSSMLSDCLPPFPPTEWSPTSHTPLFTPWTLLHCGAQFTLYYVLPIYCVPSLLHTECSSTSYSL